MTMLNKKESYSRLLTTFIWQEHVYKDDYEDDYEEIIDVFITLNPNVEWSIKYFYCWNVSIRRFFSSKSTLFKTNEVFKF